MTTPLSGSATGVAAPLADVPLADHTTLRLGGPAAGFIEAKTSAEVIEAVTAADASATPVLVLGGGSNLVVSDDGFPGIVVRIATRGRRFERVSAGGVGEGDRAGGAGEGNRAGGAGEGDRAGEGNRAGEHSGPGGARAVELVVEAGEDWDDVVADVVARGLSGLECLSGIPGRVGAVPVQNVGAYGVEVSELLTSVDLLDRRTGESRTVPAAELGLAYRTSVLKGQDDAVVLRARFLLHEDAESRPIRYAELARTLGVEVGARAPIVEVRRAVLGLRAGKGMVLDPTDPDTWSAGSFFTNPLVAGADLPAVLAVIAAEVGADVPVPQYPAGEDQVKLSAAWLIERAGFHKGHAGPSGRVALSGKHTLALTNRGGAATEELLALAREVRDGVETAFGIELHPEPVLVNCAL
ncbi:UDP-N-acetylmuramate dehydrogenase [Actinoalloteichus fjordicus]|uniref:UDP-N-acetylenolpyruvoylglucosamine reductase n=1 Tax=Actinoalloteichus fjordicus TaxID=1612552 RepID=A0AAC9L7D3_9PSEU|nr:UDP-N-acetylmuramate dehydrogenase [Actinoalloteichus fjordicus]APU12522.1 UDP-N-acetylmuramate dehydrogenase [Actinoalloteichus fjordicus]